MLSLARMNHYQNVDIVKLRKSEAHHSSAGATQPKIELKGINTHTHQAVQPFNDGVLISFCSIPLFGVFCSSHPFPLYLFLSLSLSLAFCCFCKLHRTIILVWLHFGDIYTCFSLSFDFMLGEKKRQQQQNSFNLCMFLFLFKCLMRTLVTFFFPSASKHLLSKFGKHKRNRAENKIASSICYLVSVLVWMFSLWISICVFSNKCNTECYV